MMKKQYASLEMEVCFLLDCDVITTSGPVFEADAEGDYGTDIFSSPWNN